MITLIPPADGMTVVSISRVGRDWRRLFARWLQMNNIVDTRDLAEGAEIRLHDRPHGVIMCNMTHKKYHMMMEGVREHDGSDGHNDHDNYDNQYQVLTRMPARVPMQASVHEGKIKCVFVFGRLTRWRNGRHWVGCEFGFIGSLMGEPVTVLLTTSRSDMSQCCKVVVILSWRTTATRYRKILWVSTYGVSGWDHPPISEDVQPELMIDGVPVSIVKSFLEPYYNRAVEMWMHGVMSV
jgi:hypothetical protein